MKSFIRPRFVPAASTTCSPAAASAPPAMSQIDWVASLTAPGSAIANSLRYDGLFRRNLSNITLVDLRVSAVTLHIDLGLDWCTAPTEFLENITAICLAKVLGFAGSI